MITVSVLVLSCCTHLMHIYNVFTSIYCKIWRKSFSVYSLQPGYLQADDQHAGCILPFPRLTCDPFLRSDLLQTYWAEQLCFNFQIKVLFFKGNDTKLKYLLKYQRNIKRNNNCYCCFHRETGCDPGNRCVVSTWGSRVRCWTDTGRHTHTDADLMTNCTRLLFYTR